MVVRDFPLLAFQRLENLLEVHYMYILYFQARDQLLRHQLLNDEIIKTAERRKRDRCYCDLDLFCKRSAECRKKRLNMQVNSPRILVKFCNDNRCKLTKET